MVQVSFVFGSLAMLIVAMIRKQNYSGEKSFSITRCDAGFIVRYNSLKSAQRETRQCKKLRWSMECLREKRDIMNGAREKVIFMMSGEINRPLSINLL
jgi:hypothetical protein